MSTLFKKVVTGIRSLVNMSLKTDVLALLETNREQPLSGNDMAVSLNVSRTAIWKVIHVLMEEGYLIETIHKKGYLLKEENDILSAQSILPFVEDKAFWNSIQVHPSLDSTNNEAKRQASAGAKEGTVIIAEQQSGGKGRLGRRFFSPPQSGIYVTVIFRPECTAEDSTLMTSAAAVAVIRAVRAVTGLDCQIKWVNDVYLEGKKICGILTEASMNFENRRVEYMAVGIGINVHRWAFPPELKEVATCLADHCAIKTISRGKLIGTLLNHLRPFAKSLDPASFMEEYKASSFILGQEIDIISAQEKKRATALSITEQGHLLVRLKDGTQQILSSGEISIRRAATDEVR